MNKIIKILELLNNNTEAETLDEAIIFCKDLYKSNENSFRDMSIDEVLEKLTAMFD